MNCRTIVPAALAALLLCCSASVAVAKVPYRGIQALSLRAGATTVETDASLAAAQQLGSNTIRVELPWNALQPTTRTQNDPGFTAVVDHAISGAGARGMKVLLTVDATPCWASAAPQSVKRGCGAAQDAVRTSSYPPLHAADFASLVSFLVGRYGNALVAFEDWNEPDQANQLYFAGPRKAQRYAAMVRAAYPAAKRANPHVQVLAGSMVGSNGNWLRALYAQHIKGYYDGISVHYYDLVLASLRAIRGVQLKHHDRKPLWLAEFGWDSCFPALAMQGGQRCVTAAAQAANLADVFPQLNRASYLRSALVYTLKDNDQYAFGLFDQQGAQKPAYGAVQAGLRSASAVVRPVTLGLDRSGGSVTASGSVPAGDIVELFVYQGRQLRFRAKTRPDRAEHFSIALPGIIATAGNRVVARQPWSRKSAQATI